MAYAEGTTVAVAKTRLEIEALLKKNGAQRIAHMDEVEHALVAFTLDNRLIRFTVPIPRPRNAKDAKLEALRRQRWRGLLLVIKAKFEAVGSGVTTFEEEWLAHTVMPDNQTAAQWAGPVVQRAIEARQMPTHPLALPAPK